MLVVTEDKTVAADVVGAPTRATETDGGASVRRKDKA